MIDTLKYTGTRGKARPSASTRSRLAKAGDAGKRLRLVRKKFNMSQKEMAKRFHVSGKRLSLLETGKKPPDGPLLVAIESVLMVDKRWLLTGKGEMLISPGAASDKMTNESAAVVELLKGYKGLSSGGRRKLLMVLEMLALAERKTHSA